MSKYLYFLLFVICLNSFCYGQTKEEVRYSTFKAKYDSLGKLPSTLGNDTLRLMLLDSIIESPAKTKSKSLLEEYKSIAYKAKWAKGIARYKVFYANSDLFNKNVPKATQLFLEAERELEQLKDYPMQIYALLRLSMLVTHKADSLSAQTYINKAISIAKKINSNSWLIKALNYKANTFVYRNRLDLAIPIFEEISKFKGLSFNEKIVNDLNLGTCYMYTNQVEKGLEYQFNTLRILPKNEHFHRFQIDVRFEIISFLISQKDWNKAQKIFNELTTFMNYPNLNISSFHRFYDLGYRINKDINNVHQALYFLEKKSIYQDSLTIEAKKNAEEGLKSELNLQQQTEKLQKAELEKLRSENAKQSQLRWFWLTLGIIGILSTVYVLYTNRRLKNINQSLVNKNNEISAALLQGQTIERKRVAADLHDNLGSTMSSLIWTMEAIDASKLQDDERNVYQNLKTMLSSAYDEVRLLSHNLLPDEFEKQGLTAALQYFVRKINQNSTIKFDLQIDETLGRLDNKIEFELYSICLELANNILKHSKATDATFRLRSANNSKIQLTVEDNGVGIFENTSDGKGMKNVRARVESLNGNFTLKNNTPKGAFVEIIIPTKSI